MRAVLGFPGIGNSRRLGFYLGGRCTGPTPLASARGYVQKLSKKGWLCKTWEGEMAHGHHAGYRGGEVSTLTVPSDAVAFAA